MSNGPSDDTDTPRNQPNDQPSEAREPTGAPPSGAPPRGEQGPPDSLFDRGVELLKLVFKRAFDEGIAVAYLVFFGVWSLGSAVIAGGFVAGLFATGVFATPNPDFAAPTFIGLIAGASIAFVILMIAWQSLLIGLHRPIHRTLFRGPDLYDGVGDVLRASIDRFFPILGVNAVIGVVLWGTFAGALGMGLVSSGVFEGAPSASPLVIAGLTGGWLLLTLVLGFFLGPATYFVATRDIGVFAALGRSVNFVVDHMVEFLAAWGFFVLGSFAYSCITSIGALIPCLGALIQLALNAAAGLAGLLYWAGIYILLEDDEDPNHTIVW